MAQPLTPAAPLLPSQRLRVMLATGASTITVDAEYARQLLDECAAIRAEKADAFVAASVAEATGFLSDASLANDMSAAMIVRMERQARRNAVILIASAVFCLGGWTAIAVMRGWV